MNANDAGKFSTIWSLCSESQASKKLGDPVIKFAFKLLEDFELDEITRAITIHCQQSEWMPRAAEIRRIINGTMPPVAVLLELAYADKTILGKYVRSLVNTDLNVLHPKQGESRIASQLLSIEDFYNRALIGDYTDAELRMFVAAGIDLMGPIAPRCPAVRSPYMAQLGHRIRSVEIPEQIEQIMVPRSAAELEAGRRELAKLIGGMTAIGAIEP